MDIRNYIRPIIAGLVGLGLIIVVIVLFVRLFSGGGATTAKQIDLAGYSNTAATVTLLVDSTTNIDQDHRQVKITITQTQNELDVLQGYEGNVISSRTYPNNSAAFGTFLQTLKLQNFAKGNSASDLKDYRGYCPTGERYVFTFNDGSKNLFSYWATSCSGQGTYKGSKAGVLGQFRRQIPEHDFDMLTGPIPLGF